jgi:hypothetical protein
MDAMDWLAQWGNPPQDLRQVNDLVTQLKVVLNGFQSTFAVDDPLFAMRAATAFWSEVIIATAVRLELPSGRPLQSGGYAACCTGSSLVCMPGYHRQNRSRRSPFNTCVRTWRSKWAPRLVHFICCFFTNRLLIT